ncbi:transcriptional regulator, MerR family [Fulvimarina manganoxydans]|uniref:Transcriptional regulator, MerR family n=1 Tax=Fulvimarina manganoxydans TaxID=937218 RepID=A0A1W1ZW42_9HYPH|nr:MerR family transcriptional regulator [Fulvimarina manganoxydans]SMC52640.1 transcriptional regulator, MerR family [Fulvimarina manganoxydans]
MNDKSTEAFKTIGEVASELGIPQHVLRFWETRFAQIRPLKRGGGRRYYRPEDVALLHGIRFLLYNKGFTIKGVQRLLREQGARFVAAAGRGDLDIDPNDLPEPVADEAPPQRQPVLAAVPDDLDLVVSTPHAPSPAREATPTGEERRTMFGPFLKRRPRDDGMAASHLSAVQADALQSVILDLLECKRLLDQVR